MSENCSHDWERTPAVPAAAGGCVALTTPASPPLGKAEAGNRAKERVVGREENGAGCGLWLPLAPQMFFSLTF